MNILVVKKEIDFRHSLSFFLEKEFEAQIFETNDATQGLEVLTRDPGKFGILICDDHPDNMPLVLRIQKFDRLTTIIFLKKPTLPVQLKVEDIQHFYINPTKAFEELKTLNLNQLFFENFDSPTEPRAPYFRIHTNLIAHIWPIPCEIFVKVSDDNFIKLLNQGQAIQKEPLFAQLEKKKIQFVYIPQLQAKVLLDLLNARLTEFLEINNAPPEKQHAAIINLHAAFLELGETLGFTPEVQEFAKSCVKATLNRVGQSPRLNRVIKQMIAEKNQYTTRHSVYLAEIACSLASAMEWGSETTFQKLACAALFHDMTLRNSRLAQIKTLSELEKAQPKFSEKEKSEFENHPVKISQYVATFSEIPPDVDIIIAQHHELADGAGFPRGLLSKQIAPLSALFIIAHEILDVIYTKGPEAVGPFLQNYRQNHDSGHFKKILDKIQE